MFLMFACNDTRVLLGLADGFILVYASDQLISSGDGLVQPTHTFTASPSTVLLSIQPNPGDIPELVAILRDCTNSPGSLAVELLDVQKLVSSGGWMAGNSPSTTPTSSASEGFSTAVNAKLFVVSWSPKGKQLALGLQSGDIVTYSPTATGTPKFSIPHPPSANNMSAIFIQWLSTSSFHAIYTPPGQLAPDVDQVHFHLSLDSKSNSAQDFKFNSPYLPFPGLRPPGAFAVCLRGWDPSKVLLFVGDSTASDIGVFGSMAGTTGESWHNLSLEETSTPSLPLDKDQNDTILLGLDVDLTNDSSYRHSTASGEALDLPASPIMYAYASDGTIIGWYILNVSGKSYPGMVTGSDASSNMLVASSIVREPSVDMLTTPAASPTTSNSPKTSVFQPPPATFGQPSEFGLQSSALGQPSFGQSAFGRLPAAMSSFGSATPTPFGQPAASPFDSAASSSGAFGAFTSTGPAKFGQSAFSGFGAPAQTSTVASQPLAEPASQESMVSDDDPSLSGLGLGAANSQAADSKPSIFGNTSVQVSSSQPSTGGTFIKPGTGFGAFASLDQKSPFANPASAFASTTQLSPAFGTSSFQTKPEGPFSNTVFSTQPSSGIGQSGFNQTAPTFGQSSFGRPALTRSSFGQPQADPSTFGKSSFATAATASTSTGGGFAAFASSTQTAFGAVATNNDGSAKPVWATNDSSKLDQPHSASGGAPKAVFEELTKAPTPTPKAPSPFASRDTATSTPLNAPPLAVASPSSFSTTSHIAARESAVISDSRSPSPSPTQQDDPSLFFTSRAVGPATGAFSNLKTTPSAFVKPASGFFGEVSRDSPFFSPKLPESKPASAFALAATPTSTPPKPNSAIPTFGTPSMPGGTLKSLSDPAIAAPVQPATAPGGGSFNAFSHKGSGFAAYSSGGNKSFSELLRAAGEESEESSGGGPFVSALVGHAARTSPQVPLKEPLKRPPVSPTNTELDKEETLTPKVKASEDEPAGVQGRVTEPILVQEPSLESISSSTSSSFVNIYTEEGEVIEEGTTTEGGLQDDTESFLSEVSSESDVSEEESEHPSEEEDVEKQPEPSEIRLPASPTPTRSPSTTPKAEPPKIAVEAPPPPQLPSHSGSVPRVSPVRELSTTPPGSPVKDGAPAPSPVQGLGPKPSPPATSPFSLAPRPNNRPIRSSPLASTPFVPDGGTETSPPLSRSAPPAITAQSAAPNTSFGQWTSLTTVEPEEAEPGLSPRPKTPPLLSITSGAGDKPASANVTPTTISAPSLSPFTLPATLPSFSPGAGAQNLWATPSKSVEAAPPVSFSSPFGPKKPIEVAPPTSSIASSVQKSPLATPVSTLPLPLPTAPTPEQGMQAECAFLLRTLNKEFEDVSFCYRRCVE
jgi:nucleoporin NUP159